jgi:hypothetical protein
MKTAPNSRPRQETNVHVANFALYRQPIGDRTGVVRD